MDPSFLLQRQGEPGPAEESKYGIITVIMPQLSIILSSRPFQHRQTITHAYVTRTHAFLPLSCDPARWIKGILGQKRVKKKKKVESDSHAH